MGGTLVQPLGLLCPGPQCSPHPREGWQNWEISAQFSGVLAPSSAVSSTYHSRSALETVHIGGVND